MALRFRRRSWKWTGAHSLRTGGLLAVLMLLVHVGYLLAQRAQELPPVMTQPGMVSGVEDPYRSGWFFLLRDSALIPAFGIAIVAFIVISLGHYFTFGPKDMRIRDASDAIPWWSLTERVVHAVMMVVFVVLLLTGLLITFGEITEGGPVTLYLRGLHEYAGFVFVPTLAVMALMWIKEAIPRAYDARWFAKMGGYLGYKGALTSGKFNAGQKLWYWVIAVCGVLLTVSGLLLFFDAGSTLDRQAYVVLHFFAAVPIVLMFFVHLYLSTIGTKGAWNSMWSGRFSRAAARAYHSEATPLKRQA